MSRSIHVAHELGHVLGLYDLYPEASLNNNYTIESNSEIEYKLSNYGLKQSGAIMRYCGRPTENDIEMVLLAFSENQKQYYVPNGTEQRISKAIKSNIIFNNVQYDDDNNMVIIPCKWNENTHTFDVI